MPAPAADLEQQARTLAAAGQHREALALLDRARTLATLATRTGGAGAARALAGIELSRAVSLRAIADRETAGAAAQRARTLASSAGDATLDVRALLLLAQLAGDRGDHDAAGTLLEEAIGPAGRSSDRASVANVLEALGRTARARNRNQESLDYHGRAIAAADAIGNTDVAIRARAARSVTLLGLGRYDEALADAQQAYDVARRAADVRSTASAAFGLAQAHAHIGNLDRAAMVWQEAIEAYRRAGLQIGVALALKQSMETYFALGDHDRAAANGEEALTLFDTTGSAGTTPELLARLALIEARRGRVAEARAYAGRAAALAATDTSRRRVFSENDLGLAGLLLGDPAGARRHFDKTLEVARALHDPEYEWRAQYGLGRAAVAEHRQEEARPHLTAAIAIIEQMRRTLPDAAQRATFMGDRVVPYAALVEALSADGDAAAWASLEVAERGRARSLSDLLAEARARPADARLQAVRAREVELGRQLALVQTRLLESAAGARAERAADLARAEQEYEAMVLRIRRESPAYASMAYPSPLAKAALAGLLPPEDAFVEFLFAEGGGFAWVVRGGRIVAYRLPNRERIDSAVRLIHALAAAGHVTDLQQAGRGLYDALLAPAGPLIDGARRVVFVPDGPLLRLPFALLVPPAANHRPAQWLAERHVLAVAPSATVLGELRARPPARGDLPLAAFAASAGDVAARAARMFEGWPTQPAALRHAGAEAVDAARILGAPDAARTGAAASEGQLKTAGIGRYRILHFAAHAVVDELVPRRSAVLLAADPENDGLLQVNEIPNLPIDADLVVLAACRSQLGRAVNGEGLLSLSRGFMQAGARAVLATLWDVDDAETRTLMQAFYRGVRAGAAPDAALRLAQIELIGRGGRAAAPAVWAAFVITGDGSRPLFAPSGGRRWPRWPIAAAIALILLGGGAARIARRDLPHGEARRR